MSNISAHASQPSPQPLHAKGGEGLIRRWLACGPFLCRLGAAAALALLASIGAARAETLLRLAETATVMVQPDELAADLAAEASAATPQDAQARVNAAITAALAMVRGTAGVTVATGRYSVWQVREPPHPGRTAAQPTWQASQGLMLHSADGSATLALVGRLQAQGLAVQRLGWQVSDAASHRARDEARRRALGGLRARAEAAAQLLGLRFEEFRSVDLNPSSAPGPMPRALMAAAMPGPSAVAEAVPESATVTAEAALAP
jgi:predicted secreted protein